MVQRSDPAWKRRDALHHDREAPQYDALIGREFEVYQANHTAEPWARRLAEDGASVVLDVGCGTGRTSVPVAAAGPAVIATEMSRGMLVDARRTAALAGLAERIWPVIADAEKLPFRDDCVDGIVCQGVLHHLPDVDIAVGEMDRVARAGSWICLAEPNAEASLVYRAVRCATRVAGSLLFPLRRFHSPATDDERPLSPDQLLQPLHARNYRVEATYLRHPPQIYRLLPPVASRWIMRALNHGPCSERRPADILIVRARRAPDG